MTQDVDNCKNMVYYINECGVYLGLVIWEKDMSDVKEFVKCCKCGIEKVEKELDEKDRRAVLELKAEITRIIGKKEGWSAYAFIIPLAVSVIGTFVSLFSGLPLTQTFIWPIWICLLFLLLLGGGIALYVGNKGEYCKALDYIESYLQYMGAEQKEEDSKLCIHIECKKVNIEK